MKKLLIQSALSVRMHRIAKTAVFLLIFLFIQGHHPLLVYAEKCKVGDPSVATYNQLSPSEQKKKIENLRQNHEPEREITVNAIKEFFPNAPFEVKSRLKTVASIQEKIVRRDIECFSNLTDIVGVRIIIPDYAALPIVTNTLESEFDVQEKDSFINDQRGIGYRAIHYIVVVDGHFVEIQIHTVRGTMWASLNHKLVYKGPYEANSKVDNYFKELSRAIYLLDSGLGSQLPPIPADFPPAVKSQLQNLIDSIKKYNQDKTLFSTMAEEGSKTMQEESLLEEMQPGL